MTQVRAGVRYETRNESRSILCQPDVSCYDTSVAISFSLKQSKNKMFEMWPRILAPISTGAATAQLAPPSFSHSGIPPSSSALPIYFAIALSLAKWVGQNDPVRSHRSLCSAQPVARAGGVHTG